MGIKLPTALPSNCPGCGLLTQECIPFCSRCGYDVRHHSYVKKRGKCIYCGAIGLLSREHVFGRWLAETYSSAGLRHTVQRLSRSEVMEIFPKTPPKYHFRNIERKEGNYQLKVRNVCQSCNNGWMSKLHTEAKDLVKLLADGGWRQFNASELEILSRWALMVSINLECHAHILASIRPHLKDLMGGKMPMGWRVYIGQLPTNKHANYSHTRIIETGMHIEGDLYQKVKNTAFCIEKVIFNTISTTGGDIMLELFYRYSSTSLINPHPLTCIWNRESQAVHGGIAQVDDEIMDYFQSFR